MIIRNQPRSRSGFSRRSLSAFLGGCGTRHSDQRTKTLSPAFFWPLRLTSSGSDSLATQKTGFPRKAPQEG